MARSAEATRALIHELLEPHAREKGVALADSTDLAADLDLDSMKVMELLLELEDRLDVSIPLNVLPGVRTLADLARELDRITTS